MSQNYSDKFHLDNARQVVISSGIQLNETDFSMMVVNLFKAFSEYSREITKKRSCGKVAPAFEIEDF